MPRTALNLRVAFSLSVLANVGEGKDPLKQFMTKQGLEIVGEGIDSVVRLKKGTIAEYALMDDMTIELAEEAAVDIGRLMPMYRVAEELGVSKRMVRIYCDNYNEGKGAIRLRNVKVGEDKVPMIRRVDLEEFKLTFEKGALNGRRRSPANESSQSGRETSATT